MSAYNWLTAWWNDWLYNWLNDWLNEQLTVPRYWLGLTDWLCNCISDRLTEWLIEQLTEWLTKLSNLPSDWLTNLGTDWGPQSRGQFNKAFTSVIYKCNPLFRVCINHALNKWTALLHSWTSIYCFLIQRFLITTIKPEESYT